MKRFALLLLVGCSHSATPVDAAPVVEVKPSMSAPEEHTRMAEAPPDQGSLTSLARETAAILAQRDMKRLARIIHPKRGLRLSPYAHVGEDDVTLRAGELAGVWKDPAPRIWGAYDGSGDPIRLTLPEYFAHFVYDVDFATAPQVADNRAIGSGNTVNNLLEAYPGAEFVEFHFPGFDPQYEGMDWRSLRLVFVSEGGRRWLVGIIHDQWTI
jgi:hypothetical protein